MILIPKGTTIFEPDPIHRVTIMFSCADDAVVFYEALKQLCVPHRRDVCVVCQWEPVCPEDGQDTCDYCARRI